MSDEIHNLDSSCSWRIKPMKGIWEGMFNIQSTVLSFLFSFEFLRLMRMNFSHLKNAFLLLLPFCSQSFHWSCILSMEFQCAYYAEWLILEIKQDALIVQLLSLKGLFAATSVKLGKYYQSSPVLFSFTSETP